MLVFAYSMLALSLAIVAGLTAWSFRMEARLSVSPTAETVFARAMTIGVFVAVVSSAIVEAIAMAIGSSPLLPLLAVLFSTVFVPLLGWWGSLLETFLAADDSMEASAVDIASWRLRGLTASARRR
jgi:uncharacterized protein YacL